MPESLLNCRFRGATLSYEELIVAIEKIIVDKVTTIPHRQKRIHTSAPMEIGMLHKVTVTGRNKMDNSNIQRLQFKQCMKALAKDVGPLEQNELERKG